MAYRVSKLDGAERARQKQASRDEDARRLATGEISRAELQRENSFFNSLPFEKATITKIGRRSVQLGPPGTKKSRG
ncbi:MAG: hypothetical protein Kow00114_16620 [Kiloniellaceae bacterium]